MQGEGGVKIIVIKCKIILVILKWSSVSLKHTADGSPKSRTAYQNRHDTVVHTLLYVNHY